MFKSLMYWKISVGALLAFCGGYIWWHQEKTKELINGWITLAIGIILIGGFFILNGLGEYINANSSEVLEPAITGGVKWFHWVFIVGLIYIGSVSYTIAAYYHLKIKNWSFALAFALAVPLILIEYQFSIRGNRAASHTLHLNAIQITTLTMTFYFINSWILNYFFLKQPVVWWRELLAFVFVVLAFVLSSMTNRDNGVGGVK